MREVGASQPWPNTRLQGHCTREYSGDLFAGSELLIAGPCAFQPRCCFSYGEQYREFESADSCALIPVRLFLSGHLLFDIPPGADLQPPADPAKLLVLIRRCLGAADGTLHGRLDAVGLQRALRTLNDLRCDHLGRFRWRTGGRFAFHPSTTMSEHRGRDNPGRTEGFRLPRPDHTPRPRPAASDNAGISDLEPPSRVWRCIRPWPAPCACRSGNERDPAPSSQQELSFAPPSISRDAIGGQIVMDFSGVGLPRRVRAVLPPLSETHR
jgi:hypothetical protein